MTVLRSNATIGLNIEPDRAGNIVLISNNITCFRVESTEISFPSRFSIPVGSTAQRPTSPTSGEIRFNTTTLSVEGYDGTQWVNLS